MAQLASIRQMSRQVSRGSAGEYQADERASSFALINIEYFYEPLSSAQLVKNPPAVQETWVQSLGWEDPLKKFLVTYSHLLAWRIPWTEEPGGL